MASNNNQLVFYQQWAVAWLQTDKYSTNPWCVDSKNLDIFSDTQSVKGTAWSNPTAIPPVNYVDVDERGRFYLYADGTVYDSLTETTYTHTYYDDHAETINWQDWNWAQKQDFWTPRKLFVKYDEAGEWNMIVVITDTLKYYIPHNWIAKNLQTEAVSSSTTFVNGQWEDYYHRIKYGTTNNGWATVYPKLRTARGKFTVRGSYDDLTDGRIEIAKSGSLTYNQSTKSLNTPYAASMEVIGQFTESSWVITLTQWTSSTIGTSTQEAGSNTIECEAYFSSNIHTDTSSGWDGIRIEAKAPNSWWYLFVENYYAKENWVYLKPLDGRQIVQIDNKWFMQVDENEYEEMEWYQNFDGNNQPYWTLMTSGSFAIPEGQEIVAITKTFDYRLVFVNDPTYEMWFVYLVPAGDDILTFQQAWEFPWLKFINAVMVNGYSYVIAEERGIRGLYIFYNWQTKKIVWADTKYTEAESIIDWKQIYNFTWPMLNWRGHVVAPTVNWVYMYWENKYWQNVGSFILKVDWTIASLEAKNNQLKVIYTEWANTYYRIYQDDINIKNYLSDWSITYPIQIGTHMLEKEVRDLEISYYLPWGVNREQSYLDVYISVNDYYYWTFNVPAGIPDIAAGDVVALKWWANYDLVFLEKNWTEYTFYLDWGLPYQTSNVKKLAYKGTDYDYTYMNHFKKIGRCTIDNPAMLWWKHRIFKIWVDNQLPIVRKMQIRVDWHTNWHNSPLLYSIRLLSDQQDR